MACRSRKPKANEPASPNSDDENAVPMPAIGACRPRLRSANTLVMSLPSTVSPLMTLPIEPMVCSSPQKVPNRPRKIKSPIV